MKRFFFGALWFVLMWFLTMFLADTAIRIVLSVTDPTMTSDIDAVIGYTFVGSLLVVILMTLKGWLPGTVPKSWIVSEVPDDFEEPDEPLFTITLSRRKLNAQNWELLVFENDWLFRSKEEDLAFVVNRAALKNRIWLNIGSLVPSTLSLRTKYTWLHFVIAKQDIEPIQEWVEQDTLLQFFLGTRKRYLIPIGIFLLFLSLPMPGDPASQLAATPFSPLTLLLGVGLIVIGSLSRYSPHRNILLIDAAWLCLLSASLIYDVSIGRIDWLWLILVLIIPSFIYDCINMYKRLGAAHNRAVV